MSNFLEDIEKTLARDCDNEQVESIVIGKYVNYDNNFDGKSIPLDMLQKPIDWDLAKQVLNYNYDTGYGGADCNAIYLYTKSFIVFVSEYDGATSVNCIPRNPIECNPDYL